MPLALRDIVSALPIGYGILRIDTYSVIIFTALTHPPYAQILYSRNEGLLYTIDSRYGYHLVLLVGSLVVAKVGKFSKNMRV